MHFEIVFVLLFAVASVVALLARRLRVPYTVALVITGIVLGAVRIISPPRLTKELLYTFILPGLLFEAAFHLDARRFWRSRLAILSLAVPGLVASIALTAFLLASTARVFAPEAGFGFRHALVFAALISATDPIAVVALFRSLGAPGRLTTLVEGESLFNDGTAVVVFTLILGMVSGGPLSAPGAVLDFLRLVGMGALVGLAIGYAGSRLIQLIDDPMVEIALTTVVAYGSFAAAEQFGYSGVIATVAAGMLCGNYAARFGMRPSTRVAVETFWEYVAFALNSVVFLLIGFAVRSSALLGSWRPILAAYAAVLIGRTVIVAVVTGLLRFTQETMPWSWAVVLTWGGLRGALSMVLALSLAGDFPHREIVVAMTFGVVILSILFQGLTTGPLLRLLRLVRRGPARTAYEVARGSLRSARAAELALDGLGSEYSPAPQRMAALREHYAEQVRRAEEQVRDVLAHTPDLHADEEVAVRRHLLAVEKDAVLDSFRQGGIGTEALAALLSGINARLLAVEDGRAGGGATEE